MVSVNGTRRRRLSRRHSMHLVGKYTHNAWCNRIIVSYYRRSWSQFEWNINNYCRAYKSITKCTHYVTRCCTAWCVHRTHLSSVVRAYWNAIFKYEFFKSCAHFYARQTNVISFTNLKRLRAPVAHTQCKRIIFNTPSYSIAKNMYSNKIVDDWFSTLGVI